MLHPSQFVKCCLLFLLCSGFADSQAQFNDTINYYVYYGSTGTFNKTNDGSSFVLNNLAKFTISKKTVSFHTINSWIYGEQSGVRINNDFSSVFDCDFLKDKHRAYVWAIGTFDKSYSLKINHRVQAGGGLGLHIISNPHAVLVVSDGIIYERAELTDRELGLLNYDVWRNSLRIKYRWVVNNLFVLDGTGFVQSSLKTTDDTILKSSTTLSLKVKKWLSVTSAVTYNKITLTGRENLLITYGIVLERFF